MKKILHKILGVFVISSPFLIFLAVLTAKYGLFVALATFGFALASTAFVVATTIGGLVLIFGK